MGARLVKVLLLINSQDTTLIEGLFT